MIPLTKEDNLSWKQHMREINDVTTKRVVETRLRKRKKALEKMKNLQEKVDQIAENEGLNERSKLRLMERVQQKG